jgi:sugar phosphate isomerase/epimerase
LRLPIGLMQTAGQDPDQTLEPLQQLGIEHLQLGVPGDLPLDNVAAWRRALEKRGVRLHTVFGVYTGESYADIPTVKRTVGFVPRATRSQRLERTHQLLSFAAGLGCKGFATHLGFITGDDTMIGLVREVADDAAKLGMTFALETGQETADDLLDFILGVNRDNVGVNFDPANMILYGSGDPIKALEIVGQHVLTVHAKDGNWPSAAAPDSLGTEQPLGDGAVDFPAFLHALTRTGYSGPLFIEREIEDPDQRLDDVAAGKQYLEALQG